VAAYRAVGGAPAAIDWPPWEDDLPGNVLGHVHAFTAFAPMPWWAVWVLWAKLLYVKLLPTTSLRQQHFVYFGRWTILPRLPGTGKKGDRYVLIETNYNGSFAEYLDTLAGVLYENLNNIWGRCYGCPPLMQPPSAFRRWGRLHELAAQHYYCAYPEATVKQIEMALVRQVGGSREEAQKAIRETPELSLFGRLRGFPKRVFLPSQAAPAGAHPDVVRKDTVSAVTYLTPVEPEKLEALRESLAQIEKRARSQGGESPLEQVPGTHVARWVVVDQLVNEKVSNRPLILDPPMLLFGAIGDGTPDAFHHTLCRHLPSEGLRIWTEHCRGVDGPSLPNYLYQHRLMGGLLYAGYRARASAVKRAVAGLQGDLPPERAASLASSVAAVRKEDYAHIQGNILKPYSLPYAGFVLVGIGNDRAAGRAWLAELERVTEACDQERRPPPSHACNVAFTYEGLRALGVPEQLLQLFPDDFREGMQERARRRLGDVDCNDPDGWERGLRDTDGGHVMLMLRAADETERDTKMAEAIRAIEGHGLGVLYTDVSDPLPIRPGVAQGCSGAAREHFGFADGCSQPAIDGTDAARQDKYQRVKAGEILLGYRDENDVVPGAARFFRNGSFMVFRKLEQRVRAFRRVLPENADERARSRVAAKIVGRRYDGEPLVGDRPDESSGRRADMNDFRYGSPSAELPPDKRPDDPHGFQCPLGAHIRRAFPRDALAGGETRTRRHRLLRRGMPYGTALGEDAPNDVPDTGRGLLFICFNASIARQFETIQRWCHDGNLFDVPGEADFLLAPGPATMTIQGEGEPELLARTDPLVVTRGGGYFFYPGIDALRAVTTGDFFGQLDPLTA
jgi:Dyp-type peroxidase family